MNKAILGFFANFETPQAPPKITFLKKNYFFICFTTAQSFWNNFCFWVKCIFSPPKGNFPKNMVFGAFFGNIYIIKARFTKKASWEY